MKNQEILEKAEQFKNRNMSVFPDIFAKFEGLIYTYSARIGGEDAFQELSLFLIELLYKLKLCKFSNDDELTRYISVSIRNEYIRLSKKKSRLLKEHNSCFQPTATDADPMEKEILRQAVATLTKNQRKTVIYKYIYFYTDSEIAHSLNISRQAVNRTKNRALQRLKTYFEEEMK